MRNFFLSLMTIAALGMGVSCEKSNDNGDDSTTGIKHYFGEVVEVDVDDTNMTIVATMPRMTVDGYENPKAKIKLGYEAHMADMVSEESFQTEYGVRDGLVVFKLSKLASMTEYVARIYIEDERYDYSAASEDFTFSTVPRKSKCDANCDISVEARGLFATITIDNIAYTADGEPHPLRGIEFEYQRQAESSYADWVKMEFMAVDIVDGCIVVELPAQGQSHLAFGSTYDYIVRFLPEQTITPEYYDVVVRGVFDTTNAEVLVDFTTPTLVSNSRVEDGLENVYVVTAWIEKLDISYDGVSSEELKAENYVFIYDEGIQLCYRPKGSEEWIRETVYKKDDGSCEMSFILFSPAPDTIYEACFAVFPAGDHTTGHYSEVVEINVNPSATEE